MLLAIDTSTSWAGLALHGEDGPHMSLRWRVASSHTVQLMPWIDRLFETSGLAKSQLSGVAVATGPGSFTGLRVGLAAAKGLVFSLDLPLVGVSTLLYTAWPHRRVEMPIRAVAPLGRRRLAVGEYVMDSSAGLVERWVRNVLPEELTEAGRMLYCGEIGPELAAVLARHPGPEVLAPEEGLRDPAVLAALGWGRLARGEVGPAAVLQAEYLDSGWAP
ncbi:MAG: tRNA (adenosine(37)-N6)-threonylcarbamoyltransferase complex dimerization subunit type 1 TsaB [Chloroflexota bacterium]|nr:tRNA (adenosine(37)-N6)-threonylcarbamoyltransferase complex dimerization subunit type 1 TsaB [Chloroflexota bacterium]